MRGREGFAEVSNYNIYPKILEIETRSIVKVEIVTLAKSTQMSFCILTKNYKMWNENCEL